MIIICSLPGHPIDLISRRFIARSWNPGKPVEPILAGGPVAPTGPIPPGRPKQQHHVSAVFNFIDSRIYYNSSNLRVIQTFQNRMHIQGGPKIVSHFRIIHKSLFNRIKAPCASFLFIKL